MNYEKSCGAVVFRKSHGNVEILLIRHSSTEYWSFPKGHMEESESEEQTAVREIKEETNLDVILDTTFRQTVSYSPKRDVKKQVVYFLAKAMSHELVPNPGEIAETKWVDIDYAPNLMAYDNDRQLAGKAKAYIKSKY